MEEFATLAALAALAAQVTSIIKYLSVRDGRAALTALIPWAASFVVLLLGAQADATAGLVLPGLQQTLGDLDVASIALAATAIGSTGSAVFAKFPKAIDNSDSAAEPSLGGQRAA